MLYPPNNRIARGAAQFLLVGVVATFGLGASSTQTASSAKLIAKTSTLTPEPVAAPVAASPLISEEVQVIPAPTPEAPAPKPVVVPKAKVVYKAGGTVAVSGGDLEKIAHCESGGSYTAQNSRSSASGKYQFLDGTWGGYGGYKKAKDAPANVQDRKAKETYAKSGSRPWASSRGCWGR